jgi:nitroreductase
VETWDAIRTMRAVRAFADRPLDSEHLERILRAGRRAPSSKNSQRWEFVACRDREHLRQLSKVGDFAGHVAGAAAAVAIVVPRADTAESQAWIAFDNGQAAQNMLLAAWDLGIGGVHAAVYDEDMARELLGYPAEYRCDQMLSFGYPADPSIISAPPARGGRRPLSDLAHDERW